MASASGSASGSTIVSDAPTNTKQPSPVDWNKAPYPWLSDPSLKLPKPVDSLEQRFPTPRSFQRVSLDSGSFGAWLRGLPLASVTTPVRAFNGSVLHKADHSAIAAVAALDIGTSDLQQCADSIIRLHAEWRWSVGDRKMSYKAASGTSLPYSRWAQGDRVEATGNTLTWKRVASPSQNHNSFRKYLDMVFNWANTGALARDAKSVPFDQLRPGDFFVLPGNPGHAVLVLDLAHSQDGKWIALLGQGFMPAQNFHILRNEEGEAWFPILPQTGSIKTPFWVPFPWASLRRLD